MKYRNIASALLFSALSFYSINAAVAQTSGIPSPIDGQPITDGPTSFNLGFGDDDRIPMRSNAFPWSAIGRVQIDNGGHCTGALIGRDLVLTNAHCIWVEGQRRGITFAPNYRNGQSPETVRGIPYRWGTDNPNKNRRADWAIIRLERPIGDRYGWFGYQSLNYQQLQGRTVTYAGYSTFGDEERQEFINGETAQVHIGCRVRDVFANDGVIHTDCDNGRGGSGGPIFIWQNKQPIIVGINAAEYRGESKVSFFTQNYTPGEGNVGVPTLTFSEDILQARSIPASPPVAGYDHILNKVSNLCLGVMGVDGHGPGVRVEVYHCNPGGGDAGNDNQWTIKDLGNGYSHIINKVSGLCLGVLGVDGHGPGVRVEVYHCNPGGGDAGNDNQWTIKDLGNGYSHIINKVSGLCLGVLGVDGHGPGVPVEVFHCNPGSGDDGSDNQWTLGK